MSNPKRYLGHASLHVYLTETVASRFDRSCWPWPGTHSTNGYPRIRVPGGKVCNASTVAYELRYGIVPMGRELDHLCRSRGCWNPDHLEPVTHKENIARGVRYNSTKEVCSNGHPFDADNTGYSANSRNSHLWRYCRACKRDRERATRVHRKGELQLVVTGSPSMRQLTMSRYTTRPSFGG